MSDPSVRAVGRMWIRTGEALGPRLPGLGVAAVLGGVLIKGLQVGRPYRLLLPLRQPLQHLVEHRRETQRRHLRR